nr:Asp-tRNA(Asn)/Glu-tRNA(Gln) amidotransferase subunit GatB [Mycoplasmopsis fermentans]
MKEFHLEEDTARQHHDEEGTKLDYNRAGVPLIEIVTHPVLRSADEAVAYVDMIRKIALSLNISDAKMEQGSLRADVNVSLRPYGYKGFGTKVEIKNMNSFRAIKNALEFEIDFQRKQILTNKPILQQTKRYDEATLSTVVMRTKTGEVDYKYFPEPNIPFIKLSKKLIDSVKLNELPWEREARYKKENIQDIYINSLLNDLDLAKYFDSINYADRDKLSKLFFSEIVSLANSKSIHPTELNIKNGHLLKGIELMDQDIISGRSFKKLVPLLVNFDGDFDKLVVDNNLKQISDEATITKWVNEIISQNGSVIAEYPNREERVLKFVLGALMKVSGGQVSPIKANEISVRILKNKFK